MILAAVLLLKIVSDLEKRQPADLQTGHTADLRVTCLVWQHHQCTTAVTAPIRKTNIPNSSVAAAAVAPD